MPDSEAGVSSTFFKATQLPDKCVAYARLKNISSKMLAEIFEINLNMSPTPATEALQSGQLRRRHGGGGLDEVEAQSDTLTDTLWSPLPQSSDGSTLGARSTDSAAASTPPTDPAAASTPCRCTRLAVAKPCATSGETVSRTRYTRTFSCAGVLISPS